MPGADVSNHPALMSALAAALASKVPKARGVDGGTKNRRVGGAAPAGTGTNHSHPRDAVDSQKASTSAFFPGVDWLWDAKVAFTDGVRLAVHGGDGDDEGLLCECTARGMEMSGAGFALGGGDPSPASTSATASCVVTGVRLAVATTSSTSTSTSTSTSASAAAAAAATTLRPVFRVDKFGGKWGVVAQTVQSAAAQSAAAEYVVDLEVTGATLDVACEDAATLDANVAVPSPEFATASTLPYATARWSICWTTAFGHNYPRRSSM